MLIKGKTTAKLLLLMMLLMISLSILSVKANSFDVFSVVVDGLTSDDGIGTGMYESGFYAEGYFWQFYRDGVDLKYKRSEDAETWSSANSVPRNANRILYDGDPQRSNMPQFDVHYNDTYNLVYLAYQANNTAAAWVDVWYVAGTYNSSANDFDWYTPYLVMQNQPNYPSRPSVAMDRWAQIICCYMYADDVYGKRADNYFGFNASWTIINPPLWNNPQTSWGKLLEYNGVNSGVLLFIGDTDLPEQLSSYWMNGNATSWTAFPSGGHDILPVKTDDNGLGWDCVADGDYVYVVSIPKVDDKIYFMYINSTMADWANDGVVNETAQAGAYPCIGMAGSQIIVSYAYSNTVYYFERDGLTGSWSNRIEVTSTTNIDEDRFESFEQASSIDEFALSWFDDTTDSVHFAAASQVEDDGEEPPWVAPVYAADAINATWYMRSDTHTVHDTLGYKLLTTHTASEVADSRISSGTMNITYGIRVWVYSYTGSVVELTSGSPVAQVTRSSNGAGIQSATWTCPEHSYVIDAVLVRVYQRFNQSAWSLREIFISKEELLIRFPENSWTVYYYTERSTSSTNSTFVWGSLSYNSRISFQYYRLNPFEVMQYNLVNFDISSFFLTPWTYYLGDLVWGVALLFMCITTYNWTRSFKVVIGWLWIFGGVGGILSAVVPVLALNIAWIFIAIALAATVVSLIR